MRGHFERVSVQFQGTAEKKWPLAEKGEESGPHTWICVTGWLEGSKGGSVDRSRIRSSQDGGLTETGPSQRAPHREGVRGHAVALRRAHRALAAVVGSSTPACRPETTAGSSDSEHLGKGKDPSHLAGAPLRLSSLSPYLLSFW